MILRNQISLALLFLMMCFSNLQAQTLFDKLENTSWIGKGTLMNSPATFKMNWSKELDGAFYQLNFENRRNEKNNSETVFYAKALYKVVNDSLVHGTWFDSRGVSFPLSGNVSKDKLLIIWGTPETEQGKTIYYIDEKSGIIRVEDYILSKKDYIQFGNASYEKGH